MKNRALFFVALSFIVFNNIYGQDIKKTTPINGVNLSQATKNNNQIKTNETICDTIFSFPVKDTWPTGIAWDGSFLWSCGSEFEYIYKYSAAGILIDSIPNPNPTNFYGTQGLVFDGKFLWALAEQEDKIFKLDTSDGFIINQFNIPLATNGFGLTFDGNYLWTSDYFTRFVFKIDTSNGQVLDSIQLAKPVLSIALINNNLFGIARDESHLYRIDPANGAFTDSISWCIPYPLDITWDGTYLWNISSKIFYGGKQRAYKLDIGSIVTDITNIASDNKNLELFPNPASDNLTIKINNLLSGSFYTITHITGKQIMTGQLLNETTTLNINQLVTGIYLFQVSGHSKLSYKFIKK